MCASLTFPNFRYIDTIPCLLECPVECVDCNRIKGCTKCKPGYMLYKSKCIKKCLPEIASSLFGCIEDDSTLCVPNINFFNPYNAFFIDGSNFKLEARFKSCNQKVSIQTLGSQN